MHFILKAKWLIVVLWVGLAAVLMVASPDMAQLVREKGQMEVPKGYSSTLAAQLLQDKGLSGGDEASLVLVFNRPAGLTAADKTEIAAAAQTLKNRQDELGITSIMSYTDQAELEDQLVAQDGKTILMPLTIKENGRTVEEIRTQLDQSLDAVEVDHYLTGEKLIVEDVVISSEEGLHKTELITIGFILIVLVLVFRSAVAPFVPLLTVGMSYLVSQSIVAFLVDGLNFPLSNFTQIFLVAVLFGIGTDYCILLLSRYKEEMAQGGGINDAIIRTYRFGGKTVFFAALAGMVGFASLGLAQFKLYQSASAVAIGIIVLMLALTTLVPAFMSIFGKALFWPAKGIPQHKESKFWGTAGGFALSRSWITLLLVAVVAVPLLATYQGTLSYNSMDEISDQYESVKGFDIIAESFGQGDAMPTKIVIDYGNKLDNSEGLAMIERVSREVAKIDGVSKVRSASRPTGEELSDLQVGNQVELVADGLSQGNDGIIQIQTGLAEAVTGLESSAPDLQRATAGIDQLVAGTGELNNGITQLRSGLAQVETGIRQGAEGAGQLQGALSQLKASADQLAGAANQLLAGYQQTSAALTALNQGYKEIGTSLGGLYTALTGLDDNLANLSSKYPELASDADYQTVVGTITQVKKGMEELSRGLAVAQENLSQITAGVEDANKGLADATQGIAGISGGVDQVRAGLGDLQTGMNQAADGQQQIIGQMDPLAGGLKQFSDQAGQLAQLSQLTGQLTQLSDGLSQSVTGLGEVSNGLKTAQTYLQDLAENSQNDMGGWNLPDEALTQPDFVKVLDTYLSADRELTTIDVVLDYNPYSNQALDTAEQIEDTVKGALQGTRYESAQIGIGGVSSSFADLRAASSADYQRTVVLMLGSISLILIILLRSVTMPIYLVISLLLCYFTSMSVAELVFVNVLGYPGLSWAVQFFGFVILMALGVDYSIFLMDRFNEYREMPVQEAILKAMKSMGTVIISAVIILSGTFAAMMPAGVLSLLQIATAVLTGLMLYVLLFLPFFVVVMVRAFGKANWWPFHRSRDKEA